MVVKENYMLMVHGKTLKEKADEQKSKWILDNVIVPADEVEANKTREGMWSYEGETMIDGKFYSEVGGKLVQGSFVDTHEIKDGKWVEKKAC